MAHINNDEVCCLVDSGATLCVLHPSIYWNIDDRHRPVLGTHLGQIRMADGGLVPVIGRVQLELRIGDNLSYLVDFLISDVECPVVLGMDFLSENKAILDISARSLSLNGHIIPCRSENEMPSVYRVTLCESVEIPPNSEMIVPGRLCERPKFVTGIFEMNPTLCEKKPLLLAKVLAHTTCEVPLRCINPSDESQMLYKDQVAGFVEELDVDEIPMDPKEEYSDDDGRQVPPQNAPLVDADLKGRSIPSHLKPLYDSCADRLTVEQRSMVRELLCKYESAFAMSKEDLGETDLEMHKIDTGDARPIKQAPHRMPFAKKAAVAEEVKKLKRMNVIEDSVSPWASPVVLVKKRDSRWRFVLDYRLLNKVTKADSFPLARIDDSISSLSGS